VQLLLSHCGLLGGQVFEDGNHLDGFAACEVFEEDLSERVGDGAVWLEVGQGDAVLGLWVRDGLQSLLGLVGVAGFGFDDLGHGVPRVALYSKYSKRTKVFPHLLRCQGNGALIDCLIRLLSQKFPHVFLEIKSLIRNLYRSSIRSYPARDELLFCPN
jgi:hypothetical protein